MCILDSYTLVNEQSSLVEMRFRLEIDLVKTFLMCVCCDIHLREEGGERKVAGNQA